MQSLHRDRAHENMAAHRPRRLSSSACWLAAMVAVTFILTSTTMTADAKLIKRPSHEKRTISSQQEEQNEAADLRKKFAAYYNETLYNMNNNDYVNDDGDSKIIGGQDAREDRFPYYARIVGDVQCGAALIAPDIVLTSAHCNDPANETNRAQLNLYNPRRYRGPVINWEIFIQHPQWSPQSDPRWFYDIAVVKLERPAPELPTIRINLDNDFPADRETVTLLGLGNVVDLDGEPALDIPPEPPQLAEILQEVQHEYMALDRCKFADSPLIPGFDFGNPNTGGTMITPELFCTIDDQGGAPRAGTCDGDSGSPVVFEGATFEDDLLVGVTSGAVQCVDRYLPDISVRTSFVSEWIMNTGCELSVDPPDYWDCANRLSPPPVDAPTEAPSGSPTQTPTRSPTRSPTSFPTDEPTLQPTESTDAPTSQPTKSTDAPTSQPTGSPTSMPTKATDAPTSSPTVGPTSMPTASPTANPTEQTDVPTTSPTNSPTIGPTLAPTESTSSPTNSPTDGPTSSPTMVTDMPSDIPSDSPTSMPTEMTDAPTSDPTSSPTSNPTETLSTLLPTSSPSSLPSDNPSNSPTGTVPTSEPSSIPSIEPTGEPTSSPSATIEEPTMPPNDVMEDTAEPTASSAPSPQITMRPSMTSQSGTDPPSVQGDTIAPTGLPTIQNDTAMPTQTPTGQPTASMAPTTELVRVTILIFFDRNPQETGWSLSDTRTPVEYERTILPGYYVSGQYAAIEYADLERGQEYEFTITDSGGDGFCCETLRGTYSVGITGKPNTPLLASGFGNFGQNQTTVFTMPEVVMP